MRRGMWLLAVLLLVGLVGAVSARDGDDRSQTSADAPTTGGGSNPSTAPTKPSAAEATAAPPAPTAAAEVTDAAAAGEVATVLAALPVKGRAPMTGYERDLFGDAWTDDVSTDGGHNGCDTRNDVLRRDLAEIVLKPGTQGCVVQSGALHDPYTGTAIAFARGATTSADVQIDHVVALADAWQKGAQQLTAAQRTDFANDPLNLQATGGTTNQAKGAGDAATWLPPNKAYRCTYVSRQVDVKAKYGLWVTAAERDAIAAVLGSCGAAPLGPGSPPATTLPTTTQVTPPPESAPPAPPASSEVYYESCAAARAAGAAPLHAGQPGYRAQLDGDDDGVACEG